MRDPVPGYALARVWAIGPATWTWLTGAVIHGLLPRGALIGAGS